MFNLNHLFPLLIYLFSFWQFTDVRMFMFVLFLLWFPANISGAIALIKCTVFMTILRNTKPCEKFVLSILCQIPLLNPSSCTCWSKSSRRTLTMFVGVAGLRVCCAELWHLVINTTTRCHTITMCHNLTQHSLSSYTNSIVEASLRAQTALRGVVTLWWC